MDIINQFKRDCRKALKDWHLLWASKKIKTKSLDLGKWFKKELFK